VDEEAEVIQDYPPFVSPEDRQRWDNAKGVAEALFGDQGEAAVWSATRAIFNDSALDD
jgi:hypothetical protein